MNDKNLTPLDEKRAEILRIFDELPPKGRQTFLNLARLLAHCPGFKKAIREATPDGQAAPPLDVTERLVAEWMGKEALA